MMSFAVTPSANTTTTNTLTPTTLKKITQILESEEALSSLQTFDQNGFVPPTVIPEIIEHSFAPSVITTTTTPASNSVAATTTRKTYVNLDSKSWQGGVTTVVTPSKCAPLFGTAFLEVPLKSEGENQENLENNHIPEVKMADKPLTIVTAAPPTPATKSATNTRRSTRQTKNKIGPIVRDLLYDDDDSSNCSFSPPTAKKSKRSGAGRKPGAHVKSDEDLNPEEYERLEVRRQRNKEAAARCRKRRVDLTNSLQEEVDSFEAKRRALEEEIQQLKGQKEELEFILEAHSHTCKLQVPQQHQQQQHQPQQLQSQPQPACLEQQQPTNLVVAVKSEPVIVEPANAPYIIPEQVSLPEEPPMMVAAPKPKRPMSLNIGLNFDDKFSDKIGITIETPSSIIPTLGFDSVTTGLTPSCPMVSSIVTAAFTPTLNTPTNCSAQQRSSESSSSSDLPDFVSL